MPALTYLPPPFGKDIEVIAPILCYQPGLNEPVDTNFAGPGDGRTGAIPYGSDAVL